MSRFLLFLLIATVLTSCAPREEAFKSGVPVAPVIPSDSEESHPEPTRFDELLGEIPRRNAPRNDLEKVNLPIPFFSQAPDGDWSLPWQETCEEASITLAYYAATGKPLTRDLFRQELLNLVELEKKTFGAYEHTDVAQTAKMLKEYYDFDDFEILENPAADQLKSHLARGHLIVAPFAGRELGNPFYRQPGPLYHMMVLRGYDQKNFIVNDVGTRRGENFIYSYQTIMNAMHEWHDEDIKLGAKKVIVVK